MQKGEPLRRPGAVMFPAEVRAAQQRLGSRATLAQREEDGGLKQTITEDLAAFLGARDSVYLATASAEGQPYVQHRGGPPGFLRVLDAHRLGFADFAGNRHYITLGHLQQNDRVCLFAMDYANQTRVKVWGRAQVIEEDAALIGSLVMPGTRARIERALVITVEAWDINCHQHIARRYDETVLEAVIGKLQAKIDALESEVARLKAPSG
ncbi:MAG: pyridoxamine 5'-phosphate oxidase family protein [Pseudomonadota bacterium]